MIRALLALAAAVLATPLVLVTLVAAPTAATPGPASAPSDIAVAEIPPHLLAAYRSAAVTCPGLEWEVLAGIGWVESRHGQGRVDPASGDVLPPILGPPLDGRPGFALIPDRGQPDGFARALGPMQFLSTTWARWGTLAPDRPPTATPDPHNAYDAVFTAARYLCGGRAAIGDVRQALLTYNRSEAYVREVLAKADAYRGDPTALSTAASGVAAERAVAAALTQVGVPYVWGGDSPGEGFDCSGLVQWAYRQAGVAVPRTTSEQILAGVPVDVRGVRPGDLVFSRSNRGGQTVELGHVAIYAGGGKVVVAPRTGDVVSIRPLRPDSVQAIRRVIT